MGKRQTEELDLFESMQSRETFARGLEALAKRERAWRRTSPDPLMQARHDIRATLLTDLSDEIRSGFDPGADLLKKKANG